MEQDVSFHIQDQSLVVGYHGGLSADGGEDYELQLISRH